MSYSPQMMQVGTWDWRVQPNYGVSNMMYTGGYYTMTPPQPQHPTNDAWALCTPRPNPVWQQPQPRPAQRLVEPPKKKIAPVHVYIRNIPNRLCDASLMEAMLEQAGLEDSIQSCKASPGAQHGEVLLQMNSRDAAARCIKHFHRRRWEGVEVIAEIEAHGNHTVCAISDTPVSPRKAGESKQSELACASSTPNKPSTRSRSTPSTPTLGTRRGRTRKNWADLSSDGEDGCCTSDRVSTTNGGESDQATDRSSSDDGLRK